MLTISEAIESRKRATATQAELQRIAAWQFHTGKRYARSRKTWLSRLVAWLRRRKVSR